MRSYKAPCPEGDSMLGFILCCHHLKIFHFLTRDLHFHFALNSEFCKLRSQSSRKNEPGVEPQAFQMLDLCGERLLWVLLMITICVAS